MAGLRYFATPTIPSHIRDGQDPARLAAGFIDPNLPPYNADPTGGRDSAPALQAALNEGRDYKLAVRADGQYLLSRGIEMFQVFGAFGVGGSNRAFSPQMTCARGTVFRAADGALGNGVLIHAHFVPDDSTGPTRLYNVLLRGAKIDMGRNPDATAISFSGAQWCQLEDVEVGGEAFNIGVDGLPGSGGCTTNLTVIGGRVGVRQNVYRPTPSIHGLRLIGQSEAAVQIGGVRCAVIIAGFDIQGAPIVSTKHGGGQPSGNIVLVDGVLDAPGTAIQAVGATVYARNVAVRAGNGIIMKNGARQLAGADWQRIDELAAVDPDGNNSPLWINGTVPGGMVAAMAPVPAPIDAEPVLRKHGWEPHSVPSWHDGPVHDITAFGATPDQPGDDDAPAIHAACAAALAEPREARKPVFIPRGFFDVRQPVEVPAGVKLIGGSFTNSVIQSSTEWQPTARTALLRTADAEGELWMSDFCVTGHEGAESKGLTSHKHIVIFEGRTSNTAMVDVQINRREYYAGGRGHYDAPVFLLTGSAGGRFRPIALDLFHGAAASMAAGHRMIMIEGTRHPLMVDQPDSEGTRNSPQCEIRDAENVVWHAFKFEDTGSILLRVASSRNIHVLGGSGNYAPVGAGMYQVVEGSTDVVVSVQGRQGDQGGIMLVNKGEVVAGSYKLLSTFREGGAPQMLAMPPWPFSGDVPPPPPDPKPTVELAADPASITAGQSTTLTWATEHAETTEGSGFDTGGALEGSVVVAPAVTAIYGITATGPGGVAVASVTVQVDDAPPPQPTCKEFTVIGLIDGQQAVISGTACGPDELGTWRIKP